MMMKNKLFCSINFFVIFTANAVVAQPQLLSPVNGTLLKSRTVHFSWKPVRDARSYMLAFNEYGAWDSVKVIGTDTTFQIIMYPPDIRDYFNWTVQSIDQNGNSLSSLQWSFAVDLSIRLLYPVNGATGVPIPVAFSWDGGYDSGRIGVGKDSSSLFGVPPLEPLTKYYWQVGDNYFLSDIFSFTTADASAVQVGPLQNPISIFPNPFSSKTKIKFSTAEQSFAKVSIINLLGTEVANLFSGMLEAGEHPFTWDASRLPTGMYICSIRNGGKLWQTPLVVIG